MEAVVITALPFLLAIALSLPWVRQALSKAAQTVITTAVMGGVFALLLSMAGRIEAESAISAVYDWMPSLGASVAFYVDGLALLFGLIVSGVGALIFFYAGYYFEDKTEYNRFIVWLMSFAGAMLMLVLSGDLIVMFVAWELTSVTSFMLIGFYGGKSPTARAGAFKALFVTGFGALALIVGFIMLGVAAGHVLHPGEGTRFVADITSILSAEGLHEHEWFPIFTLLIVLGGMTKSACFPFHFWLPGAMTAPTPASAYLHSATMVKAGIFLFARLSPVMYKNEIWSDLLLPIGLVTMLVGAVFAITKRDLKALLAYSTVSKLGAIVAMIGLPGQNGLKAAFVGIVAHALYKSALFLVAGAIDHAAHTRDIDRLGGLRKQLPVLHIVTVISALSMAGMPLLLGFVAKETLLDAMLHYTESQTVLVMAIVMLSAIFTAAVGYLLIVDVFWTAPRHEIHIHKPPALLLLGPLLLACGSLTLGVFIEPVIVPLLRMAVPKAFELHAFEGFNDIFWLSMAALAGGLLVFLVRSRVIRAIRLPISSSRIYDEIITYIEWVGDNVLHTQSGYVRYYLVIILGTVAIVLIASGTLGAVTAGASVLPADLSVTITELAKMCMLALTVMAGVLTVSLREHVKAAIAYGVVGYAIGVIFLIDHAPDVALVQLLVETMATVLIIIMLGRISSGARLKVINDLWVGRHQRNVGLLRDLGISIVIGGAVFVFSLIALQNRSERSSISEWHLQNTPQVHTEDVVGAIVADFRGSDTLLEIAVFTTAALGVLNLLSRGRTTTGPLAPQLDSVKRMQEFDAAVVDEIQDATSLSTPFTRTASAIVLPVAILIGMSQILYGGSGPGDGFTAGVTIGLAVTLWFVVLGYDEAKRQLPWFRPAWITRLGLLLALLNALFPALLGKGFMGHVQYDKALGMYDLVGSFGLHITSSLIFEIAIALTVMGGLGIIVDAIAYPKESRSFAEDEI